MRQLELLAPARDLQIGIAAIDCGADAVYIAGPRFGARQAAGNTINDIRELCAYAHRFGTRIFVTLNTIIYEDELEEAWEQVCAVQDAGADALIIQDLALVKLAAQRGCRIPLHASTQCAIRTPEQAVFLESLGFSRLILERQLSLEEIRAIRESVTCELEFFVHGALCVCYSGQCYLSEHIAGRSANRGACIQACRSKYDLVDESGKVLARNKALLSLKDYNLKARIAELAEAGISSFKIEGRLKNISYVRNVVRDYSLAIDDIIQKGDGKWERGSWGQISGGFTPALDKTFNRGYTELFIDGKKGCWAAMDSAKGMGENIGEVVSLSKDRSSVTVRFRKKDIRLNNGDGFSFVTRSGEVCGFRGDVCSGNTIRCKAVQDIFVGATLFRNIDVAFEKEIDTNPCIREIPVNVAIDCSGDTIRATAVSQDGRTFETGVEWNGATADNKERMEGMFKAQISKSAGHYRFRLTGLAGRPDGSLPFMSASALNGIRRILAEGLNESVCNKKDILHRAPGRKRENLVPCMKNVSYKQNVSNACAKQLYSESGAVEIDQAYELGHQNNAELMRTRYCIRHELGLCPKMHKGTAHIKVSGPLFLINNGQKFTLHFDCSKCEMTLTEIIPLSQ